MKLLTKAIEKSLPAIYAQSKTEDPIVYVKFFTPWTSWTWYATEYNPEDKLFFGLVDGLESELGYFSLEELQDIKGPCGLKVERDRYFKPVPLSQVS
jgi:hypothetical protein